MLIVHLTYAGHCYEKGGDPPRGLQLLLGTKLRRHMVDTIVMANLGYWQLKAAPGVWTLSLAPGRSSEIYTFEGPGEGADDGPVKKQVVVQDLKGKSMHIEVVKRRGKEDEVILDPNQADDTSTSRKVSS
jgi:UDP-glucose:glycoprotein glucosyltransferase